MPTTHARYLNSSRRQRAFSLIELLTVLGIIALVLGIVIPVLGHVRNSARKSATQAQLSDIGTAISQFQISERRLPGYFSGKEMGASGNATQGFSTLENIMLDLAGGIVPTGSTATGTIQVGPDSSKLIRVDPALIGSSKQTTTGAVGKAYFTPDRKNFVAQTQVGGRVSNGDNNSMPVLVDAWGQPIVAWAIADTSARGEFSAIDSGNPARYYWNSNRAFMASTKFGRIGADQNARSLLGEVASTTARISTLNALVGNPAFPDKADPAKPGSPRSPILLHSAGQNGVFLDRDSRGGKSAGTGAAAALTYTSGTDKISGGFEDVIYTAGN